MMLLFIDVHLIVELLSMALMKILCSYNDSLHTLLHEHFEYTST